MKRRNFLKGLMGAVAIPFAASAQPVDEIPVGARMRRNDGHVYEWNGTEWAKLPDESPMDYESVEDPCIDCHK